MSVLVVAEHDNRALKPATLHAMTAASEIAKATGSDIHILVAGKEDFVTLSFKLYNQYVYGGQKVLGEMDEGRLGALQDFYAKEGLIKSKTAVKDLYTNQFVK